MSDKIDEITEEYQKDNFADSLGIDTTSELYQKYVDAFEDFYGEHKNKPNTKHAVCVYTCARTTTISVTIQEVIDYYNIIEEHSDNATEEQMKNLVEAKSKALADRMGLDMLEDTALDYLMYEIGVHEFSEDCRQVAQQIFNQFNESDKVNITKFEEDVLAATIIWMSSRITHIDQDNKTQEDVAKWFDDVDSDDIKDMHSIIHKETGLKVKDKYRHGKGISDEIVRLSDELYLPPEIHTDAFDILDQFEKEEVYKYDNKSVASASIIKSIEKNDYPLDVKEVHKEMHCKESTMNRIAEKLGIFEE